MLRVYEAGVELVANVAEFKAIRGVKCDIQILRVVFQWYKQIDWESAAIWPVSQSGHNAYGRLPGVCGLSR